MEVRVKLLVVIVALSSALAQEQEKPNGYLSEFKLFLREEKIPAIVNYFLNNSLEVHQITTQDIIQLSKLDRYDLDATLKVFNYYNITPAEAFTVDNLETILNLFDIQVIDFYNTYVTQLGLSRDQVANIVNILQIPPTFWMDVSFNDNPQVYADFRSANLTQETISSALGVAQKTENQIFVAARDVLHLKLAQMTSSSFMDKLKSQGFDMKSAMTLYNALEITPEDVYAVTKFRDIFSNITSSLNRNTTLGIFVGSNEVVVHEDVFRLLSDLVDMVTVRVELDGVEILMSNASRKGMHIYQLTTSQARFDYIEIIENYTSSADCVYVTPGKEVMVEVTDMKVNKSEGVEFLVGAPLVCEERLWGLAGHDSEDVITFERFYTEDNPPVIVTPALEEHSSGVLAQSSVLTLIFVFFSLCLF